MIWIVFGLVAYALFVSALLVCACLRAGAEEYERILAEEKLERMQRELRELQKWLRERMAERKEKRDE